MRPLVRAFPGEAFDGLGWITIQQLAARDPGSRSVVKGTMSAQRIASTIGPTSCTPLSVDLKLDNALLVVRISGELDMATAAILEDAMRPYRGMHNPVSYDLTDLTFIDCAGLRALLAPADGDPFSSRISVTSASRCVRRLLEILQLQSIIDPLSSELPPRNSMDPAAL